MRMSWRRASVLAATAALVAGGAAATAATGATASPKPGTSTPIKHLVVIYQENVSFDHYFGTYPSATGQGGSAFSAKKGTPTVNGLTTALLTSNPNGANPQRLSPSNVNDVLTCDQDHNYTDEQAAFDNGAMDKFLATLGNGTSKTPEGGTCAKSTVMNYYDGNTVTSLWNYAQHFAMSDNSYGTTFGPSSPGAINLVAGDTGGVDMTHTANSPSQTGPNADLTADGTGGFSLTSDAQPYYDDCSTRDAVAMSGKNVGDLLNAKGLSWGWFQGGFRPSTPYATALTDIGVTQPTSTFVPDQFKALGATDPNVIAKTASNQGICNTSTPVGVKLPASLGTGTGQYGFKDDYIPHHEPFEYYASTANPHHLTIPTNGSGKDTLAGLKTIGTDTQSYVSGVPQFNTPNHNYDSSDFDQMVAAIGKGAAAAVSAARGVVPQGAGLGGRARCLLRPARRAVLGHQRDQRAGEDPGLEEHRGRHLLRRLRRLVRPRVLRCDQPVHLGWRRPHRGRHVWHRHPAGGRERPLRPRPAAAAACHLALGEVQLRRPHADQPGLDHQVHRGQLGAAVHFRQHRLDLGQPEQPVRLPPARGGERPGQALPQPGDRGTGLVAASHQTA